MLGAMITVNILDALRNLLIIHLMKGDLVMGFIPQNSDIQNDNVVLVGSFSIRTLDFAVLLIVFIVFCIGGD